MLFLFDSSLTPPSNSSASSLDGCSSWVRVVCFWKRDQTNFFFSHRKFHHRLKDKASTQHCPSVCGF